MRVGNEVIAGNVAEGLARARATDNEGGGLAKDGIDAVLVGWAPEPAPDGRGRPSWRAVFQKELATAGAGDEAAIFERDDFQDAFRNRNPAALQKFGSPRAFE